MKEKSIFNSLYWHLQLECENLDNDEIVRNYFKDVLDDLMETGEKE